MHDATRRDFIRKAAMVSGVALCGATLPAISSASEAKHKAPDPDSVPPLPWGYAKLDPEEARKLGHLGYYAFECGGGSAWAILTLMKEHFGYPYTTLPLPSKEDILHYLKNKKNGAHIPQVFMQYGVGGVVNYGTLCGAANGSISAISMIFPMENEAKDISRRLMRFYETHAYPSDESNNLAASGGFYPPKLKTAKKLPSTTSHSTLCHVSVGKWCEKTGYASGSSERSERCARVTADTAAMAVKLMNAQIDGNIQAVFPMKLSEETVGCRTCHHKGESFEGGQFARGEMECSSCHSDIRPHLGENKLKTAFGADIGTWAGAGVAGTAAGIGVHAISKRLGKGDDDEE